jgi:hypothetical protein
VTGRRLLWFAVLGLGVAACGDSMWADTGAGDETSTTASAESFVMLTCGEGLPFPANALEGRTGAENGSRPEERALRAVVSDPRPLETLPDSGWRLLARRVDEVTFGAGALPIIATVTVFREDGGWEPGPTGPCRPGPYRDGLEAAPWIIVDEPTAMSTSIDVVVHEDGCANGERPGLRLRPAEVEETGDQVVVTFWIEPIEGAADCPGNPPTVQTVHLDAPLGHRTLLDGAFYPPRGVVDLGSIGSSTTVVSATSVAPPTKLAEGEPPADPAAARAEIDAAFHTAFDAGIPDEQRFTAVEDGPELLPAGRRAAAKFPAAAASISATVHQITFIDPTRAAVNFELLYEGAMLLGPQDGEAVYLDGLWKVSRETRCAIIEQAGVTCP